VRRHVPAPRLSLVPRRPALRHRRETERQLARPDRFRHALGTLVAAVALAAAGLAAVATSIGRLFVDAM